MMRYVMTMVAAATQDRKGVTALEYGVLAVAIIGGIAATVGTIGGDLGTMFSSVAGYL
jgi:Flp pilus assembly pilin Flp